MPSHPETQAAFRAGLTSPDVPAGITAVGDVARRFSVYRNTVAHSLASALAQRFPVVRRIVGAEFFRAMAQVFVADHPPGSPVLHDYGTTFPDFLTRFPPVAALPYLPDVARVEVLRGQSYHAADVAPVPPATAAARLARAPETTVLSLHPSLRILVSAHPVVTIWTMNQPGQTAHALSPAPETALIHRQGDDVIVTPLAQGAAGIITALQRGHTLGTACADATPEDAAASVATLLRWQLITDLTAFP